MAYTMTQLDRLGVWTGPPKMLCYAAARGIYLRVSETDKTWYFRGKCHREAVVMALGPKRDARITDEWLYEKSRDLRKLCKAGIDPRKPVEVAAPTVMPTLSKQWVNYMAKRKKIQETTIGNEQWMFDNKIAPFLGDLPIDRIHSPEFLELLDEMGDTPVLANRVVTCFKGFWKWTIDRHTGLDPMPWGASYKKNKEEEGQRRLSVEELKLVGPILASCHSKYKYNILFMLLTGCRVGVLLYWDPKWLVGNTLVIPPGVPGVKDARLVYLCPEAMALIEQKMLSVGGTNSNNYCCCQYLSKYAGVKHFSNHDLRRTYISFGVHIGFSSDDMMMLTSHLPPKIVRTYVIRDPASLQNVANKVGSAMLKVLGMA